LRIKRRKKGKKRISVLRAKGTRGKKNRSTQYKETGDLIFGEFDFKRLKNSEKEGDPPQKHRWLAARTKGSKFPGKSTVSEQKRPYYKKGQQNLRGNEKSEDFSQRLGGDF